LQSIGHPRFAKDSRLSYDNKGGETAYDTSNQGPIMTRVNLNTPSTTTIAVAADYADAMMAARRAKNWLFILLLLVLVTQVAIFFLLRFNVVRLGDELAVEKITAATSPTTEPAEAPAQASSEASSVGKSSRVEDLLRYLIPATTFLGTVLVVVLDVVLLLIVTIMLVGRLIGVAHVTSAFIWCVVLTVLLFPWQTILIGESRAARSAGGAVGTSAYATDTGIHRDPAFKIPGALYTWEEIGYDARHFPQGASFESLLKWARYAGFPIAALLLLLTVQARSSRGLKFALGESEVQVEVSNSRV